MMGKASLYMMDNVRAGMPLVSEIAPHVRMVRGRLRFEQGIMGIRHYFKGCTAGDIYNHRWFMEKQQYPDQPSPQFHLTEEVQCVMKIVKGLTHMTDIASRLDNTMGVISERDGNITLYNPIEIDDKSLDLLGNELGRQAEVTRIIVPTRQTWRCLEEWVKRYPKADVYFSGEVPEGLQETAGSTNDLLLRTIDKAKILEDPLVELGKNIQLLKVPGDELTNEYVMYHKPTACLFCTDLFHGGYTDFDPVNSWLCRVWFKINRNGNYKDPTLLPAFKKAMIEESGDIQQVQAFVDKLTREVYIDKLIFAHGTPALSGRDGPAQLRAQWGLSY